MSLGKHLREHEEIGLRQEIIGLIRKYANVGGGGGSGGSGEAGVSTFLALTDTPATYVGQATKVARVNAGETAIEFATLSASDVGAAPTTRTITIAGTANQVTSSAGAQDLSADRTWTLSLPQDIHTTATPTFGGISLDSAGLGGATFWKLSGNIKARAYADTSSFVLEAINTADLLLGTAGSPFIQITGANGRITLGGTTTATVATLAMSQNSAIVPLFVRTANGSVGNIQEWQIFGGTTKASVDYTGLFTMDSLTISSTGASSVSIGGDIVVGRRTANVLALASGDSLEIPANFAVGTTISSAALINATATVNPDAASQYAMFGQLTGAPTANTANRVFGLSFTAVASTNFNYTDTTGGITGLQMSLSHTGSGIITVGNAAILSGSSTSTGTFTTLHMLYALGFDVSSGATIDTFHGVRSDMPRASGGGTVTLADSFFAGPRTVSGGTITNQIFYNTSASGLNAYTANSQTRIGMRMVTMPNPGAFTGTTTAAIWLGYDTAVTTARDGILWGSGADVNLYRSAADTLKTDDNLIVGTAGTAAGSVATIDGTQTLTNKTLTAPKFADLGYLADSNGNELIILDLVASAVNEITVANAATGNNPSIKATGETNVGLTIQGKGTKGVTIGNALLKTVVTLTDGATPALDASLGNVFVLTAAGNRTIAVPTNAISGQEIIIAHIASGANRTLALNTGAGGFRFGTDITGLTATTSGLTDYIKCIYNATASKWDVIAYVKGY